LYHALHVLGHDDNHLKECMLEDAGDMLGKDVFDLP
jgi:hypothetical protein